MFHFDLEEIKGFLALISLASLASLAIRSSCFSNSMLSAQVHEFRNRLCFKVRGLLQSEIASAC